MKKIYTQPRMTVINVKPMDQIMVDSTPWLPDGHGGAAPSPSRRGGWYEDDDEE